MSLLTDLLGKYAYMDSEKSTIPDLLSDFCLLTIQGHISRLGWHAKDPSEYTKEGSSANIFSKLFESNNNAELLKLILSGDFICYSSIDQIDPEHEGLVLMTMKDITRTQLIFALEEEILAKIDAYNQYIQGLPDYLKEPMYIR